MIKIFIGHFLQFAYSAYMTQLYKDNSTMKHPIHSKFGTKLQKDILYWIMKSLFWLLSYFLNKARLFSDWLITVAMATAEKIRLHYSMRNLILHNIWKFHENTCKYHRVTFVELRAYFTHKSMGKFMVNVHYPLALNVSGRSIAFAREQLNTTMIS